jgi:[glutamine synthetase] adenylyltransferase / [glutamine synthetase]-adenylyl-L-tyrosine phosphorylase
VVTAPAEFWPQVEAAISEALTHGYDSGRIRADAAAMRARMLPPEGPWDVKHRPGGLIDVEFIAQVLQLLHVRERPDLATPTTRVALANLRRAGLLSTSDAELLILAERIWRTVQGMLRITVGRAAIEALPEVSAEPLLRATAAAGLEVVDLPELSSSLDKLAGEVRAAFARLVGPVGGERT